MKNRSESKCKSKIFKNQTEKGHFCLDFELGLNDLHCPSLLSHDFLISFQEVSILKINSKSSFQVYHEPELQFPTDLFPANDNGHITKSCFIHNRRA